MQLYPKSLLQYLQNVLAVKPVFLGGGDQAVGKPVFFVPGTFGLPMISAHGRCIRCTFLTTLCFGERFFHSQVSLFGHQHDQVVAGAGAADVEQGI